jgi:hypothetical protein
MKIGPVLTLFVPPPKPKENRSPEVYNCVSPKICCTSNLEKKQTWNGGNQEVKIVSKIKIVNTWQIMEDGCWPIAAGHLSSSAHVKVMKM